MDPAEGRRCAWCEKIIYYGTHCSNECSDKSYEQWKRCNPQYFTNKKETSK